MAMNVLGMNTISSLSDITAGSGFIEPISITNRLPKWCEIKDPADVERYPVTASKWLLTDTLESATFVPQGDTDLVIAGVEISGSTASAVIGGGVTGKHKVDVTLTSSSGRVIQRGIRLQVRER